MKNTMPNKAGFYWARWISPAEGTHEANDITFPTDWEVVEVWQNFIGDPCEADASEKFGVSVPGVRESQWLENFEWGGLVEQRAITVAEIVTWLRDWANGESDPPDADIMEVADTIESRFGVTGVRKTT